MQEFSLIKELNDILAQEFTSTELGPGDDAAFIGFSALSDNSPNRDISLNKILMSTDMLVQDVHFNLTWSSPSEIAWKALAVNESDIAAMGGKPLGFLVSLGVPNSLPNATELIKDIYKGFNNYLHKRKLKIFGGDIVKMNQLTISVTVFGYADKPVLRSGAKTGDTIYLSREIGLAGFGLKVLRDNIRFPKEIESALLSAHKMPIPETELALSLNKAGILNSMIDISDGFLQDALHLCQASKVKFVISEKALPLYNSEFLKEGERLEGLSSGDDYALLFTSSISASEKDSFDTLSRCIPIGYVKDYSQNGFIDISIGESNKTIQSLEEYLLRNKLDPKKLGYSHL